MNRDPEFANATYEEVEQWLTRGCVALVPIGSTEAHGPHLPLDTDVIIAKGMARRAAELLAEKSIVARCLPAIAYSVTDCAAEFAGTISISAACARQLLVDVAVSLGKQGARLICLVNAHLEPEHRRSLQESVDAACERGVKVIFPDCVRRPYSQRLGAEFSSGACHAGEYETSLVLALSPDRVRESVRRTLPDHDVSIGRALAQGKRTFREAGGDRAYFGFPARASAENGRRWLEELARMIVEEVEKA